MVFHEVAHGFAAYKLGDPTAKNMGRLTANPLKHIDPFGTVIMPLMLMAVGLPVFGYAKPVPYNPFFFKDKRKGDLIVGLAGPAANLVMALLGALVYHLVVIVMRSIPQTTAAVILNSTIGYNFIFLLIPLFVYINLIFMFFNLIPIPPLDGSSVLAVLLPPKYMPQYYKVQQWALPIFMIVVIMLPQIISINPISWYLDITAGTLFALLL
ncbi:MAG: site-2 protease family protein [Eggerthellales bacterium]|nr:site-2 protease family protein [Eggerthellales bacterium]